MISKAKQTGKTVKSGKLHPKAAEKEAVVNQKTPTKSSSQDEESGAGQSEQNPEIFKKESVMVEKDTPSDPSQSFVGAGPSSKKVKGIAAETIASSKSTTSENQPPTADHKQKCLPDKSKTTDSVVKMESTEVDKSTEKITEKKPPQEKLLATLVKDEEASKDASEPMQLGKSGNEAVEQDGIPSCADIKEGNVTTEVAVPEKTDKYMESKSAPSTEETPSTKKEINAQGIQMVKIEMLQVL